jgi:hypothetical protein
MWRASSQNVPSFGSPTGAGQSLEPSFMDASTKSTVAGSGPLGRASTDTPATPPRLGGASTPERVQSGRAADGTRGSGGAAAGTAGMPGGREAAETEKDAEVQERSSSSWFSYLFGARPRGSDGSVKLTNGMHAAAEEGSAEEGSMGLNLVILSYKTLPYCW